MFGSIKNLILIGLGMNKIALETLNNIFINKAQKRVSKDEIVDDFLGTASKKTKDNCKKEKTEISK